MPCKTISIELNQIYISDVSVFDVEFFCLLFSNCLLLRSFQALFKSGRVLRSSISISFIK